MKGSITFIFISLIMPAVSEIAQPVLPTFLEGIWKMENREIYVQVSDGGEKGFAYVMKKNKRLKKQ